MALFNVRIEREYTARHFVTVLVDAEDEDQAFNIVADALDSNTFDPSEPGYHNTHDDEGYDRAGTWQADADVSAADPERHWADEQGYCRICRQSHDITAPCQGATEVRLSAFEDEEA